MGCDAFEACKDFQLFFLTAALSFQRDSQPELYSSAGESRCLFSTFN
jgi:hypothetical protein